MSLSKIIQADIKRYEGKSFFSLLFSPVFQEVFNYRLYQYLKRWPIFLPLCYLLKLFHKILTYITGIQFSIDCSIGLGVFFPHHGCIVIARDVVIGEYCTISHGVTIGRGFGKNNVGCPSIGDRVLIFSGAKIVGPIQIGNKAVIGANAVVTKSVTDQSFVAGVPARIITEDSSNVFDDYWARHFQLID